MPLSRVSTRLTHVVLASTAALLVVPAAAHAATPGSGDPDAPAALRTTTDAASPRQYPPVVTNVVGPDRQPADGVKAEAFVVPQNVPDGPGVAPIDVGTGTVHHGVLRLPVSASRALDREIDAGDGAVTVTLHLAAPTYDFVRTAVWRPSAGTADAAVSRAAWSTAPAASGPTWGRVDVDTSGAGYTPSLGLASSRAAGIPRSVSPNCMRNKKVSNVRTIVRNTPLFEAHASRGMSVEFFFATSSGVGYEMVNAVSLGAGGGGAMGQATWSSSKKTSQNTELSGSASLTGAGRRFIVGNFFWTLTKVDFHNEGTICEGKGPKNYAYWHPTGFRGAVNAKGTPAKGLDGKCATQPADRRVRFTRPSNGTAIASNYQASVSKETTFSGGFKVPGVGTAIDVGVSGGATFTTDSSATSRVTWKTSFGKGLPKAQYLCGTRSGTPTSWPIVYAASK